MPRRRSLHPLSRGMLYVILAWPVTIGLAWVMQHFGWLSP